MTRNGFREKGFSFSRYAPEHVLLRGTGRAGDFQCGEVSLSIRVEALGA